MSTRFEELFRNLWRRCRERFEERLRPFEIALGQWLNATLARPDNWREGWAAFVEDWKAQGVVVSPEGYRAIEELLERMTHGGRSVAGLELPDVNRAIQTSPLSESSSFDPRAGRMPYDVGDPPPQDSFDTSDPLRFDAQGNPREVVSISKEPGWYGQLWNFYDASANAFIGPNGRVLAETIRTYMPPAPPNTTFHFDTGQTYIEMSGVLPNDQMFAQGIAIAIPMAGRLRRGAVGPRVTSGKLPSPAEVASESIPKSPYNISTQGMTEAERQVTLEYAKRTNAWLEKNGPVTVQSTKGTLRSQANAAARTERLNAARTGQPYQGQAGHVPDTALSGIPQPPDGWIDMPGKSNNVVGGGLGPRVGTVVDRITVDGKVP